MLIKEVEHIFSSRTNWFSIYHRKYCEQVDHSYLNNPNSDDPYFDWFEVKVSEKCRSLTRMLEFNDKCREKILAYLPEKVSYGTLGRKLYQPKKMIKAFKG